MEDARVMNDCFSRWKGHIDVPAIVRFAKK